MDDMGSSEDERQARNGDVSPRSEADNRMED